MRVTARRPERILQGISLASIVFIVSCAPSASEYSAQSEPNAVVGEKIPSPAADTASANQLTSAEKSHEPLSVESQMAALTGASSSLTKISIEAVGPGSNMIVAQTEGGSAGDVTLRRTAPSEYVLTLPETRFDSQRIATVVAPPGSGLIRSVRPVSSGDGTLLRIFAQPGSKLISKQGEGKVVVLAEADSPSDMMAQADPEKAGTVGTNTPIFTASGDGTKTPVGTGTPGEAITAAADTSETIGTDEVDLSALFAEDKKYVGRLISLDLQDTDIDNALRIIAEVSNLNIIASDDVQGKVTLRLIDVPWDQALDVILKTNGLDKVQEGNVIRIAPVEKLRQEREALKQATQAQEELEPLQVRYMRVSYAKAAELKTLVETVLTERGSVAYDERTNQLIIKDIGKGIKNSATLVSKLDLRTPQVLLESQIVEANRSLVRDLGARFGFNFVQSPATGNATGANFPNTIGIDGTTQSATAIGANQPIVNILLDSADATKSITAALSAYEQEGRARVISRPAVSTTNNKQATIKSIQRLRVKQPDGGVSVATGQGASAAGTGAVATEKIEVGIVLEVTPQASPDYFVLLDVNAKSSTLGGQGPDGIPIEIERSSTSTVLVSSGQTFAMGGIYKISDTDQVNGVPFLKDIPVLGFMFRDAHINSGDEELIFFVTPRIIEGSFDDAAMKS